MRTCENKQPISPAAPHKPVTAAATVAAASTHIPTTSNHRHSAQYHLSNTTSSTSISPVLSPGSTSNKSSDEEDSSSSHVGLLSHGQKRKEKWDTTDAHAILFTLGFVGVFDCIALAIFWKSTAPVMVT
jgi:hypothetical protein